MESLDCLVYVDFIGLKRKMIEQLVEWFKVVPTELGISTDIFSIDVLENNDTSFDENLDELDTIYLTYWIMLDIGPSSDSVSKEAMVVAITALLELFWSSGYPAVATCNYEHLLPYEGRGMKHQLIKRNFCARLKHFKDFQGSSIGIRR